MSGSLQTGAEILGSVAPRQLLAAPALVLGTLLIVGGLGRFVSREWRGRAAPPSGPASTDRAAGRGMSDGVWGGAWVGPGLLLLILVAGAWLRLHGLDAKTMTHTETLVPNLPWPPDAWPPPRHSFYETFWWQYHSELHPPAHYLLVWAWTQLFGTSLASLRLPSVLFGIGTIALTYRIGLLTSGRRVGLLAAAFIAFNGFHIYYSQYARVYAMGMFLALLSTLALLRILEDARHRRRWEVAYVLTCWLAVYTQTFFWLVLGAQLLWLVGQPRARPLVQRIVTLQAIVVMLGASAIAHQIYRVDRHYFPDPSLTFLANYVSFGFALLVDHLSIPPRGLPPLLFWGLALFAALLVGLGARAPGRATRQASLADDATRPGLAQGTTDTAIPWRSMLPVAAGAALVTLGFVLVAHRRQAAMALTVAVPFLALAMPAAYGALRSALGARASASIPRRMKGWWADPASLLVVLALLPTLALLVVSFEFSALNERAFLMFTPYLLVVAAGGAFVLSTKAAFIVPLMFVLAGIHGASVLHWRQFPSEARDYAGLAARMADHMRPGDLVFVRPRSIVFTPLFYYLEDERPTYVFGDYDGAVARAAAPRVWLLYFESYTWGAFETTTDEMTRALEGFRLERDMEALRARAELYVHEDWPRAIPDRRQ
jgi:4-amino-4-deoxy-L-arabinose transferase-like glycosyltransferase